MKWRNGNPRCIRYILGGRDQRGPAAASRPLTSDVFLFRGTFLRAGGLLDVDYKLALRFVFVNWSGRIVDFIIFVCVPSLASSPS